MSGAWNIFVCVGRALAIIVGVRLRMVQDWLRFYLGTYTSLPRANLTCIMDNCCSSFFALADSYDIAYQVATSKAVPDGASLFVWTYGQIYFYFAVVRPACVASALRNDCFRIQNMHTLILQFARLGFAILGFVKSLLSKGVLYHNH